MFPIGIDSKSHKDVVILKYFKLSASREAPEFEITPKNFVEKTERQYPYEQKNAQGKTVQYGICPSCLNPIQLIGISRKIEGRPYGKHTGKDISGLPDWDYFGYQYCPYAEPGKHREPDENERLPELTQSVIEIYYILRNNFDYVVETVSDEMGMRATTAFWKKALNVYLTNNGHLYPWQNESNLPYVFAMIGLQHSNLFGQRFLIGSPIHKELKKHPNVAFIDGDGISERLSNRNGYVNFELRFVNHKQIGTEGKGVHETIEVYIDDFNNMKNDHGVKHPTVIFAGDLDFSDHTWHKTQPNRKLIEAAFEIMPDLVQS